MLLVLLHSVQQDLNFFVFDVYLSRQLFKLSTQELNALFLVVDLLALKVLPFLDFGDFLLYEFNDRVLILDLFPQGSGLLLSIL